MGLGGWGQRAHTCNIIQHESIVCLHLTTTHSHRRTMCDPRVLTGAPGGGLEQNHPVLQQGAGAPGQQPVHPQTQSSPHEERQSATQLKVGVWSDEETPPRTL